MLKYNRLDELYNELRDKLCYFVNRIVNDFDASEDIVQDAFIKLIEYSEKYKITDVNLKSLLFKICKNISLNYIKRKKHFEFVPIDEIDINFYYNSIKSPVESETVDQIFEGLLSQLSVTHRIIFQLKLAEKLNNSQIGREIGISERTVRRRLKESKDFIKSNYQIQDLLT